MSFFFKSMKGRITYNSVNRIHKEDDTFTNDKEKIGKELVAYFKNLLDEPSRVIYEVEINRIVGHKIPIEVASNIVEKVSAHEIKDTLFVMDNNKAPSLDGLGAFFFKMTQEIIEEDLVINCRYIDF